MEILPVMYYTVDETAAMLRVDPRTVRQWLNDGRAGIEKRYAVMGQGKVRLVISLDDFCKLCEDVAAIRSDLKPNGLRAKTLAIRDKMNEGRRKARERKRKARASSSPDQSSPPASSSHETNES